MILRTDARIESAFASHLVEKGLLTQTALDTALSMSKATKQSLIDYLCNECGLNIDSTHQILADQLNIPYKNLKLYRIPENVIRRVPIKIVNHYHFIPLSITENTLLVAAAYYIDVKTQDELKLHLGLNIKQVLSSSLEVNNLLKRSYGLSANTVDRIIAGSTMTGNSNHEQEITSIATDDQRASDFSVINLVNEIILEGYRKRATDIHLEPYRGQFRLRYRIDGVLHDANLSQKAKSLIHPIISRIKIMSNLNIVEHRLPQDGRAIVQISDQRLDLRISCIPTPAGESIVMRVLKTEMTFDLGGLGLNGPDEQILNKLIKQPFGMILLTGPTGSGKTTTLYTCLNKIKSDVSKIISLEDPIEYEIPGITQIQIHPKIGLDFASGLRSVLRHDPDIMMVGEIRDLETAQIAVRAALTGHLIFSTLHTNDAVSGVARLLDIGIKPFMVTSSVQAIIAQRLVRVLCEHCKEPNHAESEAIKLQIMKDCQLNSLTDVVTWVGRGCVECNQTGYYGRTAIHEILLLTEALKEMILANQSIHTIKDKAIDEGMRTLMYAGWKKVLEGITTTSEIIKVASVGVV